MNMNRLLMFTFTGCLALCVSCCVTYESKNITLTEEGAPKMNSRMNRNRLNIGTYFLRPYACSEAHVKDLADCGIDFVVCMQNDPKTLDLFTKYNVGAIVTGILPG